MTLQVPRVSVGLAVRNGEPYLSEAIESVLAQTFADFELIIADNASTDGTGEICRRYASGDPRIRYLRHPRNIGGANNENVTFRLSRGEYFRWAAHDDVLAPLLLERLVEALDADPGVVLAHPVVVTIDEHGNRTGIVDRNRATSSKADERFKQLAAIDHTCEETYGLMRASVVRCTDLQLNYTDSDRTFLCQLSLFGRFTQVHERLFFKRIHPGMSTQVYPEWRSRMAWFNPDEPLGVSLPNWMQFRHYLSIVRRAPLSGGERRRCLRYLWWDWLIVERRARWMARDVVLAVRYRMGGSRGTPGKGAAEAAEHGSVPEAAEARERAAAQGE